MPSSYELWLTDDSGRKIKLLNNTYFSYSRTTKGIGTCLVGLPYDEFREDVFPVFEPDRRIDIWRSPDTGYPLRHEGTYLLRKPRIYTRETDNVQIIAFYGRDPKDLLRRRWIIQPAGYSQTLKNDYIDDMMKEIVREQMLFGSCLDADAVQDNSRAFPENEFKVQGNVSLGPIESFTFPDRNVLDVLKELQEASFQLHEDDPLTYSRIYFDVVPYEINDEATAVQGFEFRTYADLRGEDRTASALVFSVENNNLDGPDYTIDHINEENSIIVKGFGRGDSRPVATVIDTQRAGASRWNRCEGFVDASTEPDQGFLENYAYPALWAGIPREELECVFLNVGGSEDTPRSLYGVDWDLGDLLPVDYAGKRLDVEVEIVYVAVDEQGIETITGQNNISGSDQ